ncbi:thiosulfate sulfurtransferase GlpE [Dysgonomonas sp. 25]|uniref:thiosulfate sulfurtransferase GlpE n=1 Tax=Dysgonomonas sp. 25 TaxID=2302933 RepID=UPI0013D1ABCA|nr:thiosulfate sulfurtransferase GlpE [Dysgonomonas sp. 25]
MVTVECINIQQAKEILSTGDALLLDIRDKEDYEEDYDPVSYHLTNENIKAFIRDTPKTKPLIVMCYHGISSRQVAQYLVNEGFEKIYSLIGGYELWKNDM